MFAKTTATVFGHSLTLPLRHTVSALALASALVLGGCETTGSGAPASASAAAHDLPSAPLAEDVLSQATYWGARYEQDPSDAELAVRFGAALRNLGSLDEATALMSRTVGEHPNDPDVMTEYAKVLLATRRGREALQPLARAIALRPNEWQLHSLEGVAFDQMGDYASATQSYERALQSSPANPNVMNNYALSRALAEDLEGAEALLRAAIAEPGATSRMRQNLALVLGLQGKFDEAERFSRADLSPPMVENNVAYYRAMLTQPAAWSEMNAEGEAE